MIVTNDIVKSKLLNIMNKDTKLSREVRDGKLFKIRNGLYETNPNVPGYLLAGSIYGPSYLSFDFALSYYGLIPERVISYTSATYGKNKKKKYDNQFGTFLYRNIPSSVYPIGVILVQEGDYSYQIATPEKALCDKLYTLKKFHNIEEIRKVLFNDLRIDEDEFKKLDREDIIKIAEIYHSTNVSLLAKLVRRDLNE